VIRPLEALSCQELVELVTDYLEDALPPDERARFEVHVGGCGGCTRYLEQMQETIRLTGRLSLDGFPPEVEQALVDAFRDWRTR
jgi:anti-sigma factor RsiW